MIPLPNLSLQSRHGRDRKPYSRKTYAAVIAFWTIVTGTYIYDFAHGANVGPLWLNGVAAVISAMFLAGYIRILVQYKGRQVEWATTVRQRNAMVRAMKTIGNPDPYLYKGGEK